jgi:hypothetical protein
MVFRLKGVGLDSTAWVFFHARSTPNSTSQSTMMSRKIMTLLLLLPKRKFAREQTCPHVMRSGLSASRGYTVTAIDLGEKSRRSSKGKSSCEKEKGRSGVSTGNVLGNEDRMR